MAIPILRIRDYTGNVVDVPAIIGPKGDTGPQGPIGPQGEIGPQGPQGLSADQILIDPDPLQHYLSIVNDIADDITAVLGIATLGVMRLGEGQSDVSHSTAMLGTGTLGSIVLGFV